MAVSVLQVDSAVIDRVREQLGHIKNGTEIAILNSLNRAAETGRAEAVRRVRDVYSISARDVRGTMSIRRASLSTLKAVISSEDGALPLSKFKIRPGTPPKRPTPVTAVIRRGNSKQMGKRTFVARTASGHIGVFSRIGEWREMRSGRYAGQVREAIKQLYGPAIPVMLGTENVAKSITDSAGQAVLKRLDHEVERLFAKGRGK